MFFDGSRYQGLGTYSVTGPDGSTRVATRLPLPRAGPLRGYRRRAQAERLDLIAYRFGGDATGFWRLCDANNAVVPDALATRDLVGIPADGR